MDGLTRLVVKSAACLTIAAVILIFLFLVWDSAKLFLSSSQIVFESHDIPALNEQGVVKSPLLPWRSEQFLQADNSGKIYFLQNNGQESASIGNIALETSQDWQIHLLPTQRAFLYSSQKLNISHFLHFESKTKLSGEESLEIQDRTIKFAPQEQQKWSLAANEQEVFVLSQEKESLKWQYFKGDEQASFAYQIGSPGYKFLRLAPSGLYALLVFENGSIEEFEISKTEGFKLLKKYPDLFSNLADIDFALNSDTLIAFAGSPLKVNVISRVNLPMSTERTLQIIRSFKIPNMDASAQQVSWAVRDLLLGFFVGNHLWVMNTLNGKFIYNKTSDLNLNNFTIYADQSANNFMLGKDQFFHTLTIKSQHDDFSLAQLFQKQWYEGYPDRQWVWQTTGGSESFEPKYSFVPIFIGTLKAAFFALILILPISVLSALYINLFASSKVKSIVKPVFELLSSLPSVIVGFWIVTEFREFFEHHALLLILFPLMLFAVCRFWAFCGANFPGVIFSKPLLAGICCTVITIFLARNFEILFVRWFLGSSNESSIDMLHVFNTMFGWNVDSRNALLTAFGLGIAVLPITFSLCEDAFEAVPRPVIAGALALGANKWQAATRIALRAALPGLVAALLLGTARALGETMIVVMASGNTPLVDFSPLTGLRSVSATIAIELPEAAQGGTHYRVLFLMGLMLLAITSTLNSLAGVVVRRIQKKYSV